MSSARRALGALALGACQAASSTPPAAPAAALVSAPAARVATTPRIVDAAAGGAAELREGAPHVARSLPVGNGVELEVLDWGGTGRPIVLLAGLGNSAHIFDDLASALVGDWRVLGVSRRGFGGSTVTEDGYDVPSLGADLVRVLDVLELQQAFFVGHSIAGEELTWLGSEQAERVLGLAYLDAAYDRVALKSQAPPSTPEPPATPADLASAEAYAAYMSRGMGMPIPIDEVLSSFEFGNDGRFVGVKLPTRAIQKIAGAVRVPDYARLKVPTLALYALADHWTNDYAAFAAGEREKLARALPSARVLAIPHAKHYLFLTHRAEIVRELRSFLAAHDRQP